MPTRPRLLDESTVAQLGGLALLARSVAEGAVAGTHRSPVRGISLDFAEHREYSPGDDLRYVDWKVFGRTDRVYLKQFDAETTFAVTLVVDASESMRYQSPTVAASKFAYAQLVAAAVAYLVLRNGDAAGLSVGDSPEKQVVARGAGRQFLRICESLEQSVPRAKLTFCEQAALALKSRPPRGLVMMISDFFDDPAAIEQTLRRFRHARQDVFLAHILDPQEVNFEFDKPSEFLGLEQSGQFKLDPRGLRAAYQAEVQAYLKSMRAMCGSLGVRYQFLTTSQPPAVAVRQLVRTQNWLA